MVLPIVERALLERNSMLVKLGAQVDITFVELPSLQTESRRVPGNIRDQEASMAAKVITSSEASNGVSIHRCQLKQRRVPGA